MLSTENGTPSEGSSTSSVLKSFIFHRQRCTFVPATVSPTATVVTVTQSTSEETTLRLNVTSFDNDGNVDESTSGMVDLPRDIKRNLRDFTIDHSGRISALWSDRSWSYYTLSRSSSENSLVLTRHDPPLVLSRQKLTATTAISLLHLHSTYVLSAALEPGQANVEIIVWDLQYQSVLAHRTLSLPSSIPNPQLQLVQALDTSQALLVVSASLSTTRGAATSFVYSVPLSVPVTSSLAHALTAAQSTTSSDWVEEDGRDAVEEEGLMSRAEKETLVQLDETLTREGVQAANDLVAKFQQLVGKSKLSKEFADQACKRLLQPLPKGTTEKTPSSVIVLLQQSLITNGCVAHELGVAGAVLDRSDWVTLKLCLQRIKDIPEDALIRILMRLIITPPQPAAAANGMDVDTPVKAAEFAQSADPNAPPSSREFLLQVVQYPATAGPLRVAMKNHLSMDDLVPILQALDQVIGREANFWMKNTDPKKSFFAQAIQFFQHILDTFLLSIISSSSSTEPIQTSILSISTHIQNSINLVSTLDKLRGPLEPFVRAEEEKILAEKEREAQKNHVEQKWDKLKKRTEKHRKMDEAVAVYQIETLRL